MGTISDFLPRDGKISWQIWNVAANLLCSISLFWAFDISEECIESAMKGFSEMHCVSSQLVIKGFSVLWDI